MSRRPANRAHRANRTNERPPLAAKGWHVSSTSSNQNGAAPLRPSGRDRSALFREETFALDHLVQELYRDIEMLSDELTSKGDELEMARCKLREQQRKALRSHARKAARSSSSRAAKRSDWPRHSREIKSLREQTEGEREQAKERESLTDSHFLEQKLRTRRPSAIRFATRCNVLQASASSTGGPSGRPRPAGDRTGRCLRQGEPCPAHGRAGRHHAAASFPNDPAMQPFGEARTQLTAAIERATASRGSSAAGCHQRRRPTCRRANTGPPAGLRARACRARIGAGTRSHASHGVQEVVNQQRRELVEQRADITTELRLLRELVESAAAPRRVRGRRRGPRGRVRRTASRSALRPIRSSAPSWLNSPGCKRTWLSGGRRSNPLTLKTLTRYCYAAITSTNTESMAPRGDPAGPVSLPG